MKYPINLKRRVLVGGFLGVSFLFSHLLAAQDPPAKVQTSAMDGTLTLEQSYEMARLRNESLKMRREDIEQAHARRREAMGAALPDLRWIQSTIWQDTSGLATGGGSGSDSTATLKRRRQSRFNVVQPLFSGLKEFSAMNSFAAEARRDMLTLEREHHLLYLNVARSFFNVVAIETDLANIRTTIGLNEDRIRELRSRARLGRSRESEVVTADSQLANIKSDEARAIGALAVARETLSYILGTDLADRTLVDNVEAPVAVELTERLPSVEERSDIRALKEEVEARRYGVRMLRGNRWPFVDLEGNYYTHRTGFQRDIDWDVILSIDVPLFRGGAVNARVDQALAGWRRARFQLEQQSRLAVSEVKQAHAFLIASLEKARLLEDAYLKARRSYELLVRDYRLGLVTNLDVLQTLAFMQDLKRDWDRLQVNNKLSSIELAVVAEKGINP